MRYLFLLIGFIVQTSLSAQVTIEEFIQSTEQDPQVTLFVEQIEYLKEKPYRLSPLQKTEIRTQNKELTVGQQEYALRFSPANPWELRNNNRYFKAYQSALALEKSMILKEALLLRYEVVIDIYYYQQLKAMEVDLKQLVDNQVLILERQQTSSFFDADEYVELKMKQLNRLVELEEADYEWQTLQHKMQRLYPEAINKTLLIDTVNIRSISSVLAIVDSLETVSAISASIAYQQQRIEMANAEYKLEKSNINIGFLQTEFDQSKYNDDQTPINLSFGVTLPITNPNKGDMTKRKLEAIEAENELKEAQIEVKADKQIAQQRLKLLAERYRSLQIQINKLEGGNLVQTLSTLKGGDPRIIVQYREDLTKLKALSLKIIRDFQWTYIEYLAESDYLQQLPLVNYLAR